MKYQEIDIKFERSLIDALHYKSDIKLEISGKEELLYALIPKVEDYYTRLMQADDLNITHDVFFDLDDKVFDSITLEKAEELIIKKELFLDKINSDNAGVKFTNMSVSFHNDLSYGVSRIVQKLNEILIKRSVSDEKYDTLMIVEKIALLKVIGFYNLPSIEDKSNLYKARLTRHLVGGAEDTITRNIKNFYVDADERDHKYGAFLHQEEMEKLVKKLK